MKTFYLILLLLPLTTIAQENFEGKIRLLSIMLDKDSAEWIVSYGKTKVRTDEYDPKKKDLIKRTEIVDFDNGVEYKIDHINKTYSIDSSMRTPEDKEESYQPGDTAIILGRHARSYTNKFGTSPFEAISSIWVATDMKYMVPEKFRNTYELGLPENNMCWLRIHVSSVRDHYADSSIKVKTDLVKINAVEIIPGPVDQSGFIVPASYVLKGEEEGELKLEAVTQERTPVEPPPPPPPPPGKQKRIKMKGFN